MDKRVQKPAHTDPRLHSLALPLGEKTERMLNGEAVEAAAAVAQEALNNGYPQEPSPEVVSHHGEKGGC